MTKNMIFFACFISTLSIHASDNLQLTVKPEFSNAKLTTETEVKEYLKLPYSLDDSSSDTNTNLHALKNIANNFKKAKIKDVVIKGNSCSFLVFLSNETKIDVTAIVVKSQNTGCKIILDYLLSIYSSWGGIIADFNVIKNTKSEYVICNKKNGETIIFDIKHLLIVNLKYANENSSDINSIYHAILQAIAKSPVITGIQKQEKDANIKQEVANKVSNHLLKINFQPKGILAEDFYLQKLQKLKDQKEKTASDYFDIAEIYFYGRRGIPVDKSKARENYQKAYEATETELKVNSNDNKVKYIIGICAEKLLLPNIKDIDYLKASADGGYPPAEADLAFRYMKGWGENADFNKAYSYALKASGQGNMFGRAILGAYYLTVKKDIKKGVKLIQESAEVGDPGGQYMLFRCLYYTKGIVKDKELAMKVLKLSADQGFPDSVSKWTNLNKNK